MKRVEGTNTEFLCKAQEVVTITITEINTKFMVTCNLLNSEITMIGKVVTVKVGNSTKSVTLTFAFNGNGGRYNLVLSGSNGGSFNRGVLQPSDNLPEVRTYTFHV